MCGGDGESYNSPPPLVLYKNMQGNNKELPLHILFLSLRNRQMSTYMLRGGGGALNSQSLLGAINLGLYTPLRYYFHVLILQ